MKDRLLKLRDWLHYIGGVTDPTPDTRLPLGSIFWGLWWFILSMIVLVFSGQASKFIYIDF